MVDKYYRKIESVENEIENSIQISGILLKLKGYDDDLSKIKNNEKDINNNKNDITNNQKSINNNKNDINNNRDDIDNNKNDVTNNQKSINNNKNDIDNNKNDITNNQKSINNNKNDITNNQKSINNNKNDINNNKNLINTNKSSYNLNEIHIYDIKSDSQTVNKDDYFHIFEKEIINDFKKDSMLEIILKVLTEISNYVLIDFFQILCNFYDDNNKIFYTISLSTAMGSINKLSTIKSVFIVPINKDISKIKNDFFIKPNVGQESRSAQFIIKNINSNKIYVKYYRKN